MRRISFLFSTFFAAILLTFISNSCSQPKPDELASRAAKIYYDYLLAGNYEAYIDGIYQPDAIPEGYREQLLTNAKMFVWQQKESRKGIAEVQLNRANVGKDGKTADVFLILCYGDSTKEEVVVPMIEVEGNWMMK